MKELNLKKCMKCNTLIRVLEECNCDDGNLMCCGEKMQSVVANSTDAAVEKHVPVYEKVGDNIKITVPHVMEEKHYIEYIFAVYENEVIEKHFTFSSEPSLVVPYESGMKIYSYCNLHGLWGKEVE